MTPDTLRLVARDGRTSWFARRRRLQGRLRELARRRLLLRRLSRAASCRLHRGDKSAALLGVPIESHGIETVCRLLDEQLIFADSTEGPQRERFEVGAGLQ